MDRKFSEDGDEDLSPSEVENIARAIYDAFCRADCNAFIGEFSLTRPVTIDGAFNLEEIASFIKKQIE